ncbi:Twin-arginine translocation pathway signal [Prosthecomicrobium hirschii]|uniref:Twin-arginine translocation pathway signal n=1 Tax=Prosthecodimorpha hirschii TaxID=665126 RepID=A0A0P6VKL6_9HYPH|nr:twin-arginine translocation pathway signal [Prosthecomicrobium hirschii]KPL52551.1 Twin-arginine translocation pathway signal [Prosthecomicrobium hirschii]
MTKRDELPAPDKKGLSRRNFLLTGTAAAIVVKGGAIFCPTEAWALEAQALKPTTLRTLIRMARDIYPHDRLADRFYAVAVKGFDTDAARDAGAKALVEEGIAGLDAKAKAAHGVGYADVGWEADRVAILKGMEKDSFFQKVRGTLVVSLYNQKEVWPLFGYEGESASKGGYINRGFNDIAWL